MEFRITQLKMEGFRGIDDLTLEFNQSGANVLIGVNGVGKSSILDCLALMLTWFVNRIRYDPNTHYVSSSSLFQNKPHPAQGDIFEYRDLQNDSTEVHCEMFTVVDVQDVQWTLKGIKQGNDLRNESSVPLDSVKPRRVKLANPPSNEKDNEKGRFESITDDLRQKLLQEQQSIDIPIIVYYPINRAVSDVPLDLLDNQVVQISIYKDSLTTSIDFKDFFQWFRTTEDLENEKLRYSSDYRDRQLEAVRNAIAQFLPGFNDLRVHRTPPLRMTVSKAEQELIINQLSDGEKCLLAMAGDIARRLAIANPNLENPLHGSGVVLIDEIELHLHPSWERRIIDSLTNTFPHCQFIVTTHSPQVVSHVKPEAVYVLEKADHGIIVYHPEGSFGRESNRILVDLMGVDERPEAIKQDLLQLLRLIDAGDLDKARELRQQLAQEIGGGELEFVSGFFLD
ncbi:MAG: AAA family ATPase [Symploca sp. SIO1B1]|nr:AAA family ATPase [Symploca sp. SIO1C2]NER99270.1 AAA family ATPase [Symploca sp. SIO1B1]